MKVALVPEGGVIITNLIYKNGHTPLQMYPISPKKAKDKEPYKDGVIDINSPLYKLTGYDTQKGNEYVEIDVPSGIKGRLTLSDHIIREAQAAIILGRTPKDRTKMYDRLNSTILLYGGVSRGNFPKYLVYLLRKKNIPRLEMAYPTNRDELINIFERTNTFLQNLDEYSKDYVSNDDNLTVECIPYKEKVDVDTFKEIVDKHDKNIIK